MVLVHMFKDFTEERPHFARAERISYCVDTLAHIYDRHKVNYHSNGVGVYNVQKRLKLYYGEDYGITYESAEGKGTTATITIPGRQEAIR